MSRPDSINAPGTFWNETGNLWNYDDAELQAPKSAYSRVPGPAAASDSDLSQPTVLSDPAATADDLSAKRVVAPAPVAVAYRPIVGNFAAVRAVRIMEQYRSGFWDQNGVVSAVYATSQPDPSQSEIDSMYQDFLLFSYLPSAITPSSDEFADLVTPSKVAPTIQANLSQLGINTSKTLPPPVAKIPLSTLATTALGSGAGPGGASIPLEAPLQPFAQRIGWLCRQVNGGYAVPVGSTTTGGFTV